MGRRRIRITGLNFAYPRWKRLRSAPTQPCLLAGADKKLAKILSQKISWKQEIRQDLNNITIKWNIIGNALVENKNYYHNKVVVLVCRGDSTIIYIYSVYRHLGKPWWYYYWELVRIWELESK
jgi:hypothetical protein